MTVLLFVIILSLLVFVHELGHFWAARRSGIGVPEFGFGFPPRIWGVKRGETIYSINLIPFGGFVRLEGETETESQSPTSFANAPLKKKFFIMVAGVVMNYLLAWLILSSVLISGVSVDPTTQSGNRFQKLSDVRTEAFVAEGSSAAAAGLQSGDSVVSINDQTFKTTDDLVAFTKAENRPVLTVAFERSGNLESVVVEPKQVESDSDPAYGFGLQTIGILQYPWYVAPWYGLERTVSLTGQTFAGFGGLIRDLVTQGQVSDDLAGPVGIAVLTGEISQLGIISLLQFVAILSISLAVINFLPLPALDGGRAMFVVIERLRGRPVNPKVEGAIHATGFYLLILLILIISIRDIQRFEIVDRFLNLFQ